MNANRVLLLTLSERTSAKGNRYMSGWLGKASVVAFPCDEPDKFGNQVWEVFVSTPEPRPEVGQDQRPAARAPDGDGPGGQAARDGPAEAPARRGNGWRGSVYRRPATTRPGAPEADGGAIGELVEDGLEDIGRP